MKAWNDEDAIERLGEYTTAIEEATKYVGESRGQRAEATARRHLRWIMVRLGVRVDDPFGREAVKRIAGGRS